MLRKSIKDHKIAVIAISVFALAISGLIASSATSLGIKNNSIDESQNQLCATTLTNATIDAAGKLVVSSIDPACYGLDLKVGLINNSNAYQLLNLGVANTATIIYPTTILAPATKTNGIIFFNNFQANGQWTDYRNGTPIWPVDSAAYTVSSTVSTPPGYVFCIDVTVSTTSTTPITWAATFNAITDPANGDTNLANYSITSGSIILDGSLLVSDGIIGITGSGGDSKIKNNFSKSFQMCKV